MRILAGVAVLAAVLLAVGANVGAAGKPPVAAATLWAVVNVDGTLARASGAVSSAQLGADGSYEVVFNRDVTGCAWTATGADDDGLTIGVSGRDGNPAGVYLIEYDTVLARDSYSSGFDLVVNC